MSSPGGYRYGGRQKGTPNRKTQEVAEKLQALGCDPIEGMARLAMDPTVDVAIRAQMLKELAQYLYPKRKALEVSGDPDTPLQHRCVIDWEGVRERFEQSVKAASAGAPAADR